MIRVIELMAQVMEYEHALEHVAKCHLGGCPDCVKVAKSALNRDNKDDFNELAHDFINAHFDKWSTNG